MEILGGRPHAALRLQVVLVERLGRQLALRRELLLGGELVRLEVLLIREQLLVASVFPLSGSGPAGRAQGLGLVALDLFVARAVGPLELEMLADGVLENTHRAEA